MKPFQILKQKISYKKDCQSVNVKSKNGKILDVGCNITVTIPLITLKKIALFLKVLEGLNAILAKAYTAPQTPSCILNLVSREKQ